ncbi:hypothetical protein A9J41_12640 [Laribacter hongkongensis]|nr:hypothetical protein [Laribacter hongkongensis]
MGQAKQRGTREQRVAAAIERNEQRERELEMRRQKTRRKAVVVGSSPTLGSRAAMTALLAMAASTIRGGQ